MAHQIDESKPKYLSQTRFMSGRRIIKTSVTEITDENVVDVLRKALATHDLNRSEIDYLWKYYRGDQPIRNRVKDVRPEICNKITENRANEIVSFKVGYLCGEPIQYVSRNGGEEIVKQINTLNEYMFAEDKAAQDQELVEWQMICGTAFRLVLPDEPGEEDEAPFELYTLDPRDTFVVYSNEIGNKPLMAVKYSKDDNEIFHYSIYTENHYYLVDGDILVESKPHALDMIPIIEYPGNNARLGSFEIVLPLLDAINNVESNRMDGMEQLVQAFIKFINCDITKEEYEEFLQLGAIKVKSVDGQAADVGVVTTELNQTQSQDPDYSGYVKKDIFDKTASELAAKKKELNEKLTEDEQKKQKEQEEREELQSKYDKLLRESEVSKFKAKLLGMGYEEKLADATAEAMADGDTEKVFANQKKHLENLPFCSMGRMGQST